MADIKRKILLVEDEPDVLQAVADHLKRDDVEILKAFDGSEGLAVAEAERPDLVLLDLILPRMHGFEFLEKIKANQETSHIPVIVFSNLAGATNFEKAKSLGAIAYFVKTDVKLDEVVQKIVEILSLTS
ncbi:MAG: response regulator [Patescibacteria group bacterium]